ncbi:unnamed protein product [Closterium sp. NIES-53]
MNTLTPTGNIKKPPPEVVLKWISRAWKAVPADLIKKSFLTCGISNALDGSEDHLVMAHRRSQLSHEVEVDDDIQADGFWGNNSTEPESDVAASGQVFATASRSSPASTPCSCRPLSHETLLWYHCLGHPSLPRLRGMASRTLVSGLPRSLPPLPPGPAPTCLSCVQGRQRAAPHSSEFPPTEAPLQTLHMEMWGPARVSGQGHERYFLLVVDDYSHYTTVFPLRRKGDVTEVLIDWIHGARR